MFLDRDGVINQAIVREGKPYPPATIDEVVVLPGVAEAVRLLRSLGYRLLVATNQPDIARGAADAGEVERINAMLAETLGLDAVYICPHDSGDHCDCRKPKPGLLLKGARDFHVDMQCSFMVGDRWRDIEAGRSAGCRTFFIDYGYDERQPEQPDFVVDSLLQAAQQIAALSTTRAAP
ncbi:HAD family hydrolase [soil metagenome]